MGELAKGIASNVNKYKPAGKGYFVADFDVENEDGEITSFEKVYGGARDLEDGQKVSVTEKKNGKFTDVSVEILSGGGNKAKTQPERSAAPARGGYGKADPEKDARITRMACMNSANALMATLVAAGCLPKGVQSKPDLMFKTMGKYANLFYQAAQDGEFFEALPTFEGNVNEAGDDEPSDEKPAKRKVISGSRNAEDDEE